MVPIHNTVQVSQSVFPQNAGDIIKTNRHIQAFPCLAFKDFFVIFRLHFQFAEMIRFSRKDSIVNTKLEFQLCPIKHQNVKIW